MLYLFSFKAILTSEPNLPHSAFFKETVSNFLNLAFIKSANKTTDEQVSFVHIIYLFLFIYLHVFIDKFKYIYVL